MIDSSLFVPHHLILSHLISSHLISLKAHCTIATKLYKANGGGNDHQQHPDFLLLSSGLRRVVDGPAFFSFWLAAPGLLCTFDLISVDKVVKAFSTLTASLAEVYKNLIPRESAKVFPSSALTCLLASRSDLFPTSSFTTFSLPYLSTYASQFSISLKDCRSVMS